MADERIDEGFFSAHDGVRLFFHTERAATPTGHVAVVHGYAEHLGRYVELTRALTAAGYTVHLFDCRGHGQSGGKRAHVDAFKDYLSDLEVFLSRVKEQAAAAPVFLLGHSAGGLIAASYLLSHPDAVRGVVLASPYFRRKLYVPPLKILAGKLVGRVLPSLPMKNALKPEQLTRDVRIQNATRSDPLYQQIATPRWFNESNAAQEIVLRRATEFVTPFLLLFGGADPIADPAGGRDFFEHATSKDKQHKVYDGLLHELFHEPEREAVFKDVVGWLDERARGASARAAGAR
ncbi:MAG TPA: alpha/beta hydrolase [Myxococcales bacterium]|nr:alpha/beta hydrolase [Myxococcales bacterium]